jgi:tRNA modification GTPase
VTAPGGLPSGDDTIVALATPAGRGALALLRVSGPQALEVLRAITQRVAFAPRMATRARLVHPVSRAPLDDALVTWFPAPRSYTGDDTAELSVHGGVAVSSSVLGACLAAGARLAEPGEFTRRALLAGKLDLLQAEAVADLIDARSQALHRAALEQLDGGLSRRVQALREQCLGLEALLAYDIDFPEEDDGPVQPARITHAVTEVLSALDDLLATAPSVPLLRDGAIVVLAGAPNAGKSSLLNALSGEARALVTEVPGTTRDAIEVLLDTSGVPIRLVDTAGLRETNDLVERLGIEVSARWLARAHVVLACGETEQAVRDAARVVRGMVPGREVPVVGVVTKVDAAVHATSDATANATFPARSEATSESAPLAAWVRTSAERGTGLGALLSALQHELAERYGVVEPEVPRLTRERHHAAVRLAREELAAFRDGWNGGAGVPALVAAVHVRAAVAALDEVIGAVSLEDVLDRLFRDFCVGK